MLERSIIQTIYGMKKLNFPPWQSLDYFHMLHILGYVVSSCQHPCYSALELSPPRPLLYDRPIEIQSVGLGTVHYLRGRGDRENLLMCEEKVLTPLLP